MNTIDNTWITNQFNGRSVVRLRIALAVVVGMALLGIVSLASASGAVQISGVGHYPMPGECEAVLTDAAGNPYDLTLKLTGDLDGCLYTWVDTSVVHPSGTYNETGHELFVAADGSGSFETTYRFTAKADDLVNFTGQQYGRCQHPIVSGSGTGSYAGVKGRFDVKDNIVGGVAVDFPYTGHLKFN